MASWVANFAIYITSLNKPTFIVDAQQNEVNISRNPVNINTNIWKWK